MNLAVHMNNFMQIHNNPPTSLNANLTPLPKAQNVRGGGRYHNTLNIGLSQYFKFILLYLSFVIFFIFNSISVYADDSNTFSKFNSTQSYSLSSNASYTVNTAHEYSIIYKTNGASGSDFIDWQDVGSDYTISGNCFECPVGRHFVGWKTNSDSGLDYEVGSSYNGNRTLTLYAQWEKNKYTVTFVPNGGSYPNVQADSSQPDGAARDENGNVIPVTSGGIPWPVDVSGNKVPYTQVFVYDELYKHLPEKIFNASNSVYDFDGWYTSKTGGNKILNTTTVTNAKNHTLYARYYTASFKITKHVYHSGGGYRYCPEITKIVIYKPNGDSKIYNLTSDNIFTQTFEAYRNCKVIFYHNSSRIWKYWSNSDGLLHRLGTGQKLTMTVPKDADGYAEINIWNAKDNVNYQQDGGEGEWVDFTYSTSWLHSNPQSLKININ